ncbi:MAG: glycosyltransferase family 9 protein [Burkholderiaceae bacterium]
MRVAVFRALQLGDMLCAVPALRALRARLPDARITLIGLPWATQFVERFSGYLDDFVAFPGHPDFPEQPFDAVRLPAFEREMRARGFDLAVQMHGSGRISNGVVAGFGARVAAGCSDDPLAGPCCFMPWPETGPEPLRLLALTTFLGAPSAGTHLEFPVTPEDERELADSGLAAALIPGRYLCVHPGARFLDKCWPAQRFAEIADALADAFGLTVVLTGSGKERGLAEAVANAMRHPAVNAAAPISIGAMAALMRDARLLVCNDTGVSHIAAGLRLPSVVIFSKADIARWSPLDTARHRCIWDPAAEHAATVLREAGALLAQPAAA